LTGDIKDAKNDLLTSIELVPSFTQSLVKIASVHMEQGDSKKAFECFEEAIKHNPDDPDIYYHRGQGRLILKHVVVVIDADTCCYQFSSS
jgi:mitochondrial import receptor subunit TOM70